MVVKDEDMGADFENQDYMSEDFATVVGASKRDSH
jgi:hypothetical protein